MTQYKVPEERGKARNIANWVAISLRDFDSNGERYVPEKLIAALEQLDAEYAWRANQLRLIVMRERRFVATMDDKEDPP